MTTRTLKKVLIANRGGICIRVEWACRYACLTSVAVCANPDREAMHVKLADEAYSRGVEATADSYRVREKLIDIARHPGAHAVHPG